MTTQNTIPGSNGEKLLSIIENNEEALKLNAIAAIEKYIAIVKENRRSSKPAMAHLVRLLSVEGKEGTLKYDASEVEDMTSFIDSLRTFFVTEVSSAFYKSTGFHPQTFADYLFKLHQFFLAIQEDQCRAELQAAAIGFMDMSAQELQDLIIVYERDTELLKQREEVLEKYNSRLSWHRQ